MYNLEHEFLNISYSHPAKIARDRLLCKLREYAEKYAIGDLLDVGCGMKPYDYFRFTKFGIEKLFSSSNFQIVSIENCEGSFAAIGQLKIISIYNRRIDNLFLKIILKLINKVRVPIINLICLAFDKFYDSQDNKLCLNYIVVAKRVMI